MTEDLQGPDRLMELLKKKRQQSSDSARRSAARERRDGIQSDDQVKSTLWQQVLLLVCFSLLLGVLVTPHYIVLPINYQVGDVADRDVKAAHDFLVTDETATEKKREETGRTSMAIYDLDEETVQHLRKRMDVAFTMMRAIFQQPAESGSVEKGASAEGSRAIHKSAKEKALEKKKDFEAELGITISDTDYAILVKAKFDLLFEDAVIELAENVLAGGVVGNKSLLLSQLQNGVVLRSVQKGTEHRAMDALSYLSVEAARRQMRLRASAILEEDNRRVRTAMVHLAQALLPPNITFNRNETELRRQKAVEAVKPVFFQVR